MTPILTVTWPDGRSEKFALTRALTSLGKSPESDITLAESGLADCALTLKISGEKLAVTALSTLKSQMPRLAGKPKARLEVVSGGSFELGTLKITFGTGVGDAAQPKSVPACAQKAPAQDVAAVSNDSMAMLLKFSEALLQNKDLPGLLELMLDQVIALTCADRGFLLLAEAGGFSVRLARNAAQKSLGTTSSSLLSESIVRRALETGEVQLIDDALSDPDFSQSASVMTRGFHSVLCMPLAQGGETIGLIYLGNDRYSHRFDARSVELLKIWSAHGSLILKNALLMNELTLDNGAMSEVLNNKSFGRLVGDSAPMRDLFRKIAKVAPTDASVLIIGETGTGKELVAEEIHRRSRRAKKPFVTVNCAAIPENLMESELFGHLRGAFTGAVATRRGKFQAADGGTLFLDEVGEMPPAMQVKLLRAIQEKTVTKVGDNRAEHVDIRIIAATNRILEDEVRRGTFREDLYYRLNVVRLSVPPLRERGSDIPLLASFFLALKGPELMGPQAPKGFSQSALSAMRHAPWPGNVRQLEHAVEKAAVMAEGDLLTEDDLGLPKDDGESAPEILPLAQAKDDFQRRYIDRALELNDGNRAQTAKVLGVDPRTIYRHLEARRGSEGESAGRPSDLTDKRLGETDG